MRFAPGYYDGQAPFGTWTVEAAYFPSGWLDAQDPASDLAVLRLAPRSEDGVRGTVEATVGSAAVGQEAKEGDRVTAIGYPDTADTAIRCSNTVAAFPNDESSSQGLYCQGFSNGTSGSPWLTAKDGRTTLVGIIGGVHQGGCTDAMSYSTPLGNQVAALVERADAAEASDNPPAVPENGC